jgi:hypothetical protein
MAKNLPRAVKASLQRYVSPDLTHFVGAKLKSRDARYKRFEQILKGRLLEARPRLPQMADPYRALEKNPERPLSSNEACTLPAVCFCDIPLSDLPLHMTKYKDFGISFTKDFLADQGATPMLYVPTRGRPAALPYEGYSRGRVKFQRVSFDEFWKLFNRVDAALTLREHTKQADSLMEDLRRLITFLEFHVIGQLKFFDHRLDDSDLENYYMEREWRVCQDVEFSLGDVVRAIIPERYCDRFRRDFPDFNGEVFFADRRH